MVALQARMRWMRARLHHIRCGLGAATLPKSVKGFELKFANKDHPLRLFWRHYLPRLKYHNENLFVTVEKVEKRTLSSLKILYQNGKEPVEIHARDNPESIIDEVLKITQAEQIPMTGEEEMQAEDTAKCLIHRKERYLRFFDRRVKKNMGKKKIVKVEDEKDATKELGAVAPE